MKKIISIILIVMSIIAIIISNNIQNKHNENNNKDKVTHNQDDDIVKVMEDVYIDYLNDISLDPDKYIGKTIEIEGMFIQKKDDDGNKHMYIYRYGDKSIDSHNEDSHHQENHSESENNELMYGLEFTYNRDDFKENDWIKVIGKIKEDNGQIIIKANSVKVTKERGKEKVKSLY